MWKEKRKRFGRHKNEDRYNGERASTKAIQNIRIPPLGASAIKQACTRAQLSTGELIKHGSSKARARDRNDGETVKEREEKKGVLGVGLGRKRTTLTRSGEGVGNVRFYFLPHPAALSVRAVLVCEDEGGAGRGT